MSISNIFKLSLLSLISTVILGCSYETKRPDDLPELYPTEVSVKFDGIAIKDVKVSLIPVDKSKWSAAGSTNDKGIAKLSTSFSFNGVPTGQYIIAFSKNKSHGAGENVTTVESEIPLKYGVTQSKEIVEIKPQHNKLIFNLNGGSEKIIINEPTNSSLKRKEM